MANHNINISPFEITFQNVPQSYVPGTAIECHYSLGSSVKWSSKDWIGLYKISRGSLRDYYTFVWSPPPHSQDGSPRNCCVRFEASYLPTAAPTLYQFLYIDGRGSVRGSSPTFSFCQPQPGDGDHLLLDDGETASGLVLVVSRSTFLEGQLTQSEQARSDLEKQLEETESENRKLGARIQELERQWEERERENQELGTRIQELERQWEERENGELGTRRQELERQWEETERENGKLRARIQELETNRGETEGENRELGTRIQELERQWEERERENGKLRARIQELETNRGETERENRELRARIQELETGTGNAWREQTWLAEQCQLLATGKRRASEECRELREQQVRAQEVISQLEADIQTLEYRLSERETVLDRARDRLRNLSLEHERLRKEESERRQLMQVQLSETLRKCQDMRTALGVLETEKAALQKEMWETREYVQTLEQSVNKGKRQNPRDKGIQTQTRKNIPALVSGSVGDAVGQFYELAVQSDHTHSRLTDRVVISQPAPKASQRAQETEDWLMWDRTVPFSSPGVDLSSSCDSGVRCSDVENVERGQCELEEGSHSHSERDSADGSLKKCPICNHQFPEGCGKRVLEEHIDSHFFMSTNDPFTFQ